MAKQIIQNAKVLVNGSDISGDINETSLLITHPDVDVTVYGSSSIRRLAGLQDWEVSVSGFYEAGTDKVDTVIFPLVGTSNNEITVCPVSATSGQTVYLSQTNVLEYEAGGSVGDAMGFNFVAKSEAIPMVRGEMLIAGFKESTAATVSGYATEITATSAGAGSITLPGIGYGMLHVTSSSGQADRTLDVKIQSDATSSFASPTTVFTFTQITTTQTSQMKQTTASTTDTWWRGVYTIAGTLENAFTVYLSLGVYNPIQ